MIGHMSLYKASAANENGLAFLLPAPLIVHIHNYFLCDVIIDMVIEVDQLRGQILMDET